MAEKVIEVLMSGGIGQPGSTIMIDYETKEGECGTGTQRVVGAQCTVDWISASTNDSRLMITVTKENVGKPRVGYVIPTVNGEQCDNNMIKVTQDTKESPIPPTPTDCQQFIVDGGEYYLDSEGYSMCDSAFLNVSQDKAIPTGKPDWVECIWKHWDVPGDRSEMCSDYGMYPCVAESLMRHAGLLDCQPPDKSCKPKICNTDPGHAQISDMPALVQSAIRCEPGSYGHALGTIIYKISPNTTSDSRECTITWYINDKKCESATLIVHQEGTGSTSSCNYKLTINGLPEGETATVNWDNVSKEYGNGEHVYSTSKSRVTAEISKDNYLFEPSTMVFRCNSETAFTTTATEGKCTCDKFKEIKGIAKLAQTGGDLVVANYIADCVSGARLEHKNGEELLDLEKPYKFVNGYLTAYLMPNTSTMERAGAYSINLDNALCSTFGISQKGVEVPPDWDVDINLKNNTDNYICIRDVLFILDGYPSQVTNIAGCANGGGQEYLDEFHFDNVSRAPEGCKITEIRATVSDSPDSPGATKRLSIDNNILTDGGSYLLTYNG